MRLLLPFPMVIAQALGEYGAIGALITGFEGIYYAVRDVAGEWGMTGLFIAVGAVVVWSIITRVR